MLVVSDTSPVTNLLQIDQLDLLRLLFGEIIVPESVFAELYELPRQRVALDSESWIHIQLVTQPELVGALQAELDAGEAEAIALAVELKADYLLIDERKGRAKAESLGLRIVGLLGILVQAKRSGHIPMVEPLLLDLRQKAGFRIHPDLYKRVLQAAGE